jgi:hypothetical protein
MRAESRRQGHSKTLIGVLCAAAMLLSAGARAQQVHEIAYLPVVAGHVVVPEPLDNTVLRYRNEIVAGMKLFYKKRVSPPTVGTIWHYRAAFEFRLEGLEDGETLLSARLELPETGRGGTCTGVGSYNFALAHYEGNGLAEVEDVDGGDVIASVSITSADRQTFPQPIDVTGIVADAIANLDRPYIPGIIEIPPEIPFVGFNLRQTNEANCARYYDPRFVKLILTVRAPMGGVGIRG